MKKKCKFCLSVMLWLVSFLMVMNGLRRKEEALAQRIAPEILRFHVLANSSSPEDQALKLTVKDLLLKEIREGIDPQDAESRDGVCRYIEENRETLERKAMLCMEARGFSYGADIRLEQCEFPEKTYGDMTFPAGTYDAVRVLLGDGKGENFWCVLYPSLCYLDSTHAVVPASSKEQLKSLLSEDDFAALLKARQPQSLAEVLRPAEKPAASGAYAEDLAAPAPGQKNTGQDASLPRIKFRLKLAELTGIGR